MATNHGEYKALYNTGHEGGPRDHTLDSLCCCLQLTNSEWPEANAT